MLRGVSKPHGHSVDDYLEAIHMLVSPIGVYEPAKAPAAIAARVAEALGVSRTAVGEMLKRLTADGLLERTGGRELVLTEKGTLRAEAVIRRNRIVETFLTEFLGYDLAEAHAHAGRVAAAFTDDMVERLHAKLGYPERCPHGWPVAPAQAREESLELVPLADLGKGDSGEIVRQSEADGGLLSWFDQEGLRPGAKVQIRDHQPAAGHFTIEVGGDEQFIADRAARGLFVRRAPRGTT
jgi:DtxR family transcriptional regulator, Mn-dependent transcriptional regulator